MTFKCQLRSLLKHINKQIYPFPVQTLTKLNLTMITPIVYDAFTGIGISKKKAIIGFLYQYSEATWMDATAIQKSVEYAIKETPSFGGFIITAEEEGKIVAVLIVNKTGMVGYMPEYIAVQQAILPTYKKTSVTQDLITKAATLTKGDIAVVVNSFGVNTMELQDLNTYARQEKVNLLRKVQ